MPEPYTPETIDIKMAYVTSFDPGGAHKFLANMVAEMTTGHAADFDRWLEKHDREVRAQALRDAADAADAQWMTGSWALTDGTGEWIRGYEAGKAANGD